MKKEIGSFIEIDENQKQHIFKHTVAEWLKEKKQSNKMQLFCSGRNAIKVVIEQIESIHIGINKVCLLPQYTCESVISPFIERNWKTFFYPVDLNLHVDTEKFQDIIFREKPSILLIHPYYGMDIGEDVKLIIQKDRQDGLICIEDDTQSLSFLGTGNYADYYVASLRKWFDIPDGAVVLSERQICLDVERENEEYVRLKKKAQILKSEYLKGRDVNKDEFLALNIRAEQRLCDDTNIYKISEYSKNRLENNETDDAFLKRIRNSKCLFESLKFCRGKIRMIGEPIDSPLYVPIYVDNRNELQNYLIRQGIYASVIWARPRQIISISDKNVEYIYEHILALPCDQRYSDDDMGKIVYYIKQYDR